MPPNPLGGAPRPAGCDTARAGFYDWVKVAAEIARIAPAAQMDIDVVRIVVAEEERLRA